MKSSNLILFIRLSRPLFLVGGFINYALGVGIARYLGTPLNWSVIALGQVWVTSLQLSVHYLNEYFDIPHDLVNKNRTPFTGGSGVLGLGEGKLRPVVAMVAAACTLTAVALASWVLLRLGAVNPIVITIMVLALLGAIFYSVPPVRLATSGYGEVSTALVLAVLVPAFGFALQTQMLHRLLAMSAFPLAFLTIASMLSLEFPDYYSDLKTEKLTLFVRLGWQRAIRFHHILVVAGYLLLAAAIGFGLPLTIGLPAFLSLPLAGLQVWYINRIEQGAKPNWTALTFNGVAFTVLAAYLLAFGFWTR